MQKSIDLLTAKWQFYSKCNGENDIHQESSESTSRPISMSSEGHFNKHASFQNNGAFHPRRGMLSQTGKSTNSYALSMITTTPK
jgi:hypothetical protein